jgi:hypothetical protein
MYMVFVLLPLPFEVIICTNDRATFFLIVVACYEWRICAYGDGSLWIASRKQAKRSCIAASVFSRVKTKFSSVCLSALFKPRPIATTGRKNT